MDLKGPWTIPQSRGGDKAFAGRPHPTLGLLGRSFGGGGGEVSESRGEPASRPIRRPHRVSQREEGIAAVIAYGLQCRPCRLLAPSNTPPYGYKNVARRDRRSARTPDRPSPT